MNEYDLLSNVFYDAFDRERLRKFINDLMRQTVDKGVDIFDPAAVEESIKDQCYLFNLLLDGILNATRQTHNLPDDLEVRILLRDRDDFNANIVVEAGRKNKYILWIDNLMTETIHNVVEAMLYWSIVEDNISEWSDCLGI